MATSSSSVLPKKDNAGFTLLETLVVMGIVALLTSVLVGYSRESIRQLQLAGTEAKILNLINQAKFLSIETFFKGQIFKGQKGGDRRVCAYGVHINRVTQEIFIFQDTNDEDVQCPANNVYNEGKDIPLEGELNKIKLDPAIGSIVTETTLATLDEVVFVPPDPKIIINNDPSLGEASIVLKGGGSAGQFVITINNAGQIKRK